VGIRGEDTGDLGDEAPPSLLTCCSRESKSITLLSMIFSSDFILGDSCGDNLGENDGKVPDFRPSDGNAME